jgi:hypothetical protein
MQEESACFTLFYACTSGISATRTGSERPGTPGRSEPPQNGDIARPARRRAAPHRPYARMHVCLYLLPRGERGGALINACSSGTPREPLVPARRARGWDVGRASRADGPAEPARFRHDARRMQPVIRRLGARLRAKRARTRAEAWRPACHLSGGVPGRGGGGIDRLCLGLVDPGPLEVFRPLSVLSW